MPCLCPLSLHINLITVIADTSTVLCPDSAKHFAHVPFNYHNSRGRYFHSHFPDEKAESTVKTRAHVLVIYSPLRSAGLGQNPNSHLGACAEVTRASMLGTFCMQVSFGPDWNLIEQVRFHIKNHRYSSWVRIIFGARNLAKPCPETQREQSGGQPDWEGMLPCLPVALSQLCQPHQLITDLVVKASANLALRPSSADLNPSHPPRLTSNAISSRKYLVIFQLNLTSSL